MGPTEALGVVRKSKYFWKLKTGPAEPLGFPRSDNAVYLDLGATGCASLPFMMSGELAVGILRVRHQESSGTNDVALRISVMAGIAPGSQFR